MVRIILRNLLVALGIALPVLVTCAGAVTWLVPSTWAGGARPAPSLAGFVGGLAFWYLILVLPTLAIALLHQLALAALPHGWSSGRERAVIITSAVGLAALIGVYLTATASDAHVAGLVGALLPAALAYGVLVRPVRSGAERREDYEARELAGRAVRAALRELLPDELRPLQRGTQALHAPATALRRAIGDAVRRQLLGKDGPER